MYKNKPMQQPTAIKYIKPGPDTVRNLRFPAKFNTQLFIPVHINDNDKQLLKIKTYKYRPYIGRRCLPASSRCEAIFLPIKKIKGVQLVANRVYEVEIKTRQWKEFTVITYHLSNTLASLSQSHKITDHFKPKKSK